MQERGQLFNAKILWFSMVGELQSSSQGLGSTLSSLSLRSTSPRSTYCVLHRLGRGGLISLFSGSLGWSDIFSAKNDAEKTLSLLCPLGVTQEASKGERVYWLLTRAQQDGKRQQHLDSVRRLGQDGKQRSLCWVRAGCHSAPTVSPFFGQRKISCFLGSCGGHERL